MQEAVFRAKLGVREPGMGGIAVVMLIGQRDDSAYLQIPSGPIVDVEASPAIP
jgi:hypothetical protein